MQKSMELLGEENVAFKFVILYPKTILSLILLRVSEANDVPINSHNRKNRSLNQNQTALKSLRKWKKVDRHSGPFGMCDSKLDERL